MNRRQQFGIGLLIGWAALPFVSFAGALYFVFTSQQLSWTAIAFESLVGLPFVYLTCWYAFLAIDESRSRPVTWRFIVAGVAITILVVGVANAYPGRTTEDYDFRVFDEYWYFAPQKHYGFPWPFYRVFDDDQPDPASPEIGKTLFDAGSLIGDLVFLSFLIYVWVSITILASDTLMFLQRNGFR